MDALVDALLTAARPLLATVGVWEGARPPLTAGLARISLLTPEGLHFTEGAFTQLAEDQPTAAVFAAGTALMSALIDRARSREPYPQNASGGHRDPRKSADLRGRHPRMSAARTPKGRPSLRECRSRALSRRLLPSPCC